MSLLREIQDAAVDGTTPLAVVLRKCMVLAARLGHEPFKKWGDEELNGYPPDADLPEYRRIADLISIGSLAEPLGRQLKNAPLALAPVPPHVRDRYEKAEFREGVAKLADMATPQEGGGKLAARWPGDLVSLVSDKYYQGYVLLEAYIEIPRSAVVGVLETSSARTWSPTTRPPAPVISRRSALYPVLLPLALSCFDSASASADRSNPSGVICARPRTPCRT